MAAGTPRPARVRVRGPVAVGARAAPRPAPIGGRELGRERLLPARLGNLEVPDEVGQERDLLASVVDPATDQENCALLPGRPGLPWSFGKMTTSMDPCRSSRVATAIVDRDFVMMVRTPVTTPPMTTRWPSSVSSLSSPE